MKNKAMKEVKKVEMIVTVTKMKLKMMKGKVEKNREMKVIVVRKVKVEKKREMKVIVVRKVKVEIKMGKEVKVDMMRRMETEEKKGKKKKKKMMMMKKLKRAVEVVTAWKALPPGVGDRASAMKMADEVLKHLMVIGLSGTLGTTTSAATQSQPATSKQKATAATMGPSKTKGKKSEGLAR
ncbi:hypothetical protein Scep_001487 [Stephania cephalantha]|uniref:Uncharacterized protein n=1 Tax=Stephania cephalantha TaxID=152367 RepID=A0AAP0L8A0_9MAGN